MINQSNFNSSLNYDYNYIGFGNVITLFGIFLNLLLSEIIFYNKSLHKIIYMIILITSIADCITNTGIAIISIINLLNVSIDQGKLICRIFAPLSIFSNSMSVTGLCLICIDRYFSIINPLSQMYKIYKGKFFKLILVLEVGFSILFAVPSTLFVTNYPEYPFICDFVIKDWLVSFYLLTITSTLYVLPGIFMTIGYGRIIHYLKRYIRPGVRLQSQILLDRQRKKRFITMMIIVGLSHLLLSWPFHVVLTGFALTGRSFHQLITKSSPLYYLTMMSTFGLSLLSIINPVLYFIYDNNIREGAFNILPQNLWYKTLHRK